MSDLIIIGAGPVGLYGGLRAALHRLDFLILEGSSQAGGQVTALYPEKEIVDMPGIISISGKSLISNMLTQLENQVRGKIVYNSKVVDIIKEGNEFKVVTELGQEYKTKYVLICTGVGEIHPNKLGVEGEEKFIGKGIYYGASSISDFSNKRVVIVGAGDSAFDWALEIMDVAQSVTIIQHNNRIRALEANVEKFKQHKNASIILNTSITKFVGNENLEKIIIKDEITGEIKEMETDAVIIAIGNKITPTVFPSLSLKSTGNYLIVDQNSMTSEPGIYAAGDVVYFQGSKLISIGCAQAAIAIEHISKQIKGEILVVH
jgi:thioredoxin reductase (NADPH)